MFPKHSSIPSRNSSRLNTDEYGPAPEYTEDNRNQSWFWDTVRFALIAALIVIPIRLYVASPFIVSGASMQPTFNTGHYLIVDQLTYQFHKPQRGDVVVFQYPNDPDKFFIKRIVGLPEETITLTNGEVVVENQEHPDGIVLSETYLADGSRDTLTFELRADEYFVLGDNRSASLDSRVWGALPEELITGRVMLRLLPLHESGLFPGKVHYVE